MVVVRTSRVDKGNRKATEMGEWSLIDKVLGFRPDYRQLALNID